MDNSDQVKNENPDDIENNTIGDGTLQESSSEIKVENTDLATINNAFCIGNVLDTSDEYQTPEEKTHNAAVEDVIYKALEKVKDFFFHNEIEEQKLAEFMFKILTLNVKDMNPKDFKMSPEILDQLVDQIIVNHGTKTESESFNDVIDNIFGSDAAKELSDNLCAEKIDEVVERLLGEDTKNLICQKLESENLDDLLNKLIDEKIKLDDNPEAKHPNFDDFIQKILGKETEEFIRNKLEAFLNDKLKNEAGRDSKLKQIE